MPNNPNIGPLVSVLTAFLSAVMAVLDAFNVFHFNPNQQGAVMAVAIASVALGLYLYSTLQSWHVITVQKLGVQTRLAGTLADERLTERAIDRRGPASQTGSHPTGTSTGPASVQTHPK